MQLKDATILIVDDEAELLEYFTSWFKREGCRVLAAGNGKEALELATSNQVDVLVSDIRMPVMDGVELVKNLREIDRYVPKILFVSGHSDYDDRDFFDLGVEARLPKPLSRMDLVSAVKRSLTERNILWSTPSTVVPRVKLEAIFESVAVAQEDGLIAFGRGGFCLKSRALVEVGQVIGLALEFKADHQAIIGQGIVRWIDYDGAKIGIQTDHIDEQSCAWLANLAEHSSSMAFIPRDCTAAKPGG